MGVFIAVTVSISAVSRSKMHFSSVLITGFRRITIDKWEWRDKLEHGKCRSKLEMSALGIRSIPDILT